MLTHFVLSRKLNHRNIELYHTTQGETVGVRLKNGEYKFERWLGFITGQDAKASGGRPVKLLVSRIGQVGDLAITWEDVPHGRHVQGCQVTGGVYAVVTSTFRVV